VSFGPALFFARRILGVGSRKSASGRSTDASGSRYLRGAVIGVALSIVPLVVVLVVSDGMIEGITARYIEVGTYHLQAQPLVIVDGKELLAKAAALRDVPGITGVFPEYQGYGVAIAGTRTAGVAVRAIDGSFLSDPGTAAFLKVKSGLAKLDATNQILLGEALSRSLGVKVGDTIGIDILHALAVVNAMPKRY